MNNIKYNLEKARKYEVENMDIINDDKKPLIHLSSPIGWINDPNGFSVFKDEYHLFCQYHPYSKAWGPMHWAHFKSKDLIKWEHLPVALAPYIIFIFLYLKLGKSFRYSKSKAEFTIFLGYDKFILKSLKHIIFSNSKFIKIITTPPISSGFLN